VPHIARSAKFSPDDTLDRILDDLACPACGHQDPGSAHKWLDDNQLRIFCEGCGAFVTVSVTDEQARAIHRRSTSMPAIANDPLQAARPTTIR
jgi:transcription elongation factor Elf1